MVRSRQPGIYVEALIHAPFERVWDLTQAPDVHQRWDLRFSRIHYLPRASDTEPQRFLYETRIGLGLAIRGTGESIATRHGMDGDATSSLKFASNDPKSLISEGAGYWKYAPTANGTRFFTWYDYRVRFGWLGRAVDRWVFRPLISWATAWSFDRMRLWAEQEVSPEMSLLAASVHGIARLTLTFVWIWHGLVPKLLFRDPDEQTMLQQAGLSPHWLVYVGSLEIALGIAVLLLWRQRWLFVVQTLLMAAALVSVAARSPAYLHHAFNPVTLNLLVIALALAGWLAWPAVPCAARCLRSDPRARQQKP